MGNPLQSTDPVFALFCPSCFLPTCPFLPRWLYWTDWGDTAYIGRAGMDGTNVSAIITTKLEWPNALTIDYTTNKIFFADSHLNFLEWVMILSLLEQVFFCIIVPVKTCNNSLLHQPSVLQTWTARTATGPSLAHFPMFLQFPCLRTGFTGPTGTHTQWRRPTSTQAKNAHSWATTHIGPRTFTSTTPTDSLAVRTF